MAVLEQVARLEHPVDLAAAAADLLEQLRAVWVRETRWRNAALPTFLVHVAGPVIDCKEYRRSWSATYIVDRRQTCSRCGEQLIRGRWAVFVDEGAHVASTGGRAPIVTPARGSSQERECTPSPL